VRPGSSGASDCNSWIPRAIRAREIPVARSTIAMPPWPIATASAAAHRR
jgi:hypothetical protein